MFSFRSTRPPKGRSDGMAALTPQTGLAKLAGARRAAGRAPRLLVALAPRARLVAVAKPLFVDA